MKQRYFLFFVLVWAGLSCGSVYGQLITASTGFNIYLPGQFLEIGQNNLGALGTCDHDVIGPAPVTYHPHIPFGPPTTHALASVYDYGHDGWLIGTPAFYGDYTLPGSPFEGWAIEVGPTSSDLGVAYTQNTGLVAGSGTTFDGGNVSYTDVGGVLTGVWQGTTGIDGVVGITQTTTMDTTDSWVVFDVLITNNGTAVTPEIYYMRSCDPDQESTDAIDATSETDNTIVYQNDVDHRVMVSAHGLHYTDDYLGLCTKDCRARAFVYETWPPPSTTPLSSVYAYSPGSTSQYGEGNTLNGDYGIGLIYDLGELHPGVSSFISYGYIYDGDNGIDSAFPDPQMIVNNVATDSVDTINTCAYAGLTSLPVSIANSTTKQWTWSQWKWAPTAGLATDTGVNNTVNVLALGSTVTYTITGSDSAMGDCAQRTFLLTVIPCLNAESNSPDTGSIIEGSQYTLPICEGDTLMLFALPPNPGATFTWYNPAGVQISTELDPVIPHISFSQEGKYMVVKTLGDGTSDTAYTTVLIKPLPTAVLSSNAPICSGIALRLHATLDGSTIDSTDVSFNWKIPRDSTYYTATSADSLIVFSASAVADTGTYKLITTLDGCVSDTSIRVIIDSTPGTPNVSSNAGLFICSDSTLYLTATDTTTTFGGYTVTWNWQGPNGFTAIGHNPSITNVSIAANGTYVATATLGACKSVDSTIVIVNPTPPLPVPSVISPSPLCTGGTLSLDATDTPGTTFSWRGPDGFTSMSSDPSLSDATLAAGGEYSVVATLNGCVSSMAQEDVLVDSTPQPVTISSNGPVCQGDTLQLYAADSTSGLSYNWTGPFSFSSATQNPVIYNVQPTASGLYHVIASLGTCSVTASMYDTVKVTPSLVSINSNTPVCSQYELDLYSDFTPSLGTTYNWSGPLNFSNDSADASASDIPTSGSGIYSVTATFNGCTSPIATVTVVVDSTPLPPTAMANTPVCQGDTLKLTATDGTDSVSYAWFGPDGYSSAQQNPDIPNIDSAHGGDYTVNAILGVCTNTAVVTVSVTPTPSFVPTSNSPVCSGDTLQLHANGAAGASGYIWTGPYAFYAASHAPDPLLNNVTTENAGVYTVTVTLNGCSKSEEDTVAINQTPAPPFVNWLTYCQYYNAPPLMATGDNITWYPADTIFNGNTTAPVPSTATAGATFYFATQTVSNCISTLDSIQVTVNPSPNVSVSPKDTGVCPHSTFALTAVDTDAIAYYRWYPTMYLSGGTTATVQTSPETGLTYTVIASNQYGCSDTDTVHIVVYPAALISIEDSVTLYPGETYTISPSTNCTSFNWFPSAGLSATTIPDPVADPAVSTKYIVTGQTDNGCTTSDSISIHVSANSLLALPNAFTPGTATNSEFKVIKKGEATLNYFRIFNRWGQKVFETTNIDAGWDGTYNGTAQPLGVYVYEIEAVTSNGKNFVVQGNVTLLR